MYYNQLIVTLSSLNNGCQYKKQDQGYTYVGYVLVNTYAKKKKIKTNKKIVLTQRPVCLHSYPCYSCSFFSLRLV